MKKYKDIFIDFDDTLYDTHGNAIIALSELFNHFGLSRYFKDPDVFYRNYWKTNTELWGQYAHGEIERDYLMVERFRRPLNTGEGIDASTEFCLEVSDKFLDLCSAMPGTVDGAHELIKYLKSKDFRLHICSNGFHEVQYKKLKASRLFDYFDTIILSEDAGANKPSKQFFDFALQESKADKETTIMIGDNLDTDILGAMNVGLDTILFNRWDKNFKPQQPVTYIVSELKEIMEIL